MSFVHTRKPMALRALTLLLFASACHFSFDRELGPGEIRGTVMSQKADGGYAAVSGAHVVLENSTIAVNTDTRGRFVLKGLRAGEWSISITASLGGTGRADSGLRLRNLSLTQEGGKPSGLDLGRVVIGAFGALAGTVDRNGEPMSGPTATLTGIAQKTVQNGTFTFTDLLPGEYDFSLLASVDGVSQALSETVTIKPHDTTQLEAVHLETVPSVGSGSIAGQVHLEGASSSSGVNVVLSSGSVSSFDLPTLITVGSEGRFTATDLAAGVYTITASLDGFAPISISSVSVIGASDVPTLTLLPLPADDPGAQGSGGSGGSGGSTGSSAVPVPTRSERIERACQNAALCGALTPFDSVDQCEKTFEDTLTDLGDVSVCSQTSSQLLAVADCLGGSPCGAFQSIACAAPQVVLALLAHRDSYCATEADEFVGHMLGDGRDPSERGLPVIAPGSVITLSGNGQPGIYEGTGGAVGTARLNSPTGIAVDAKGFVYIADRENQRIRRADPWGDLSTITGDGFAGTMEGPVATAEFAYPTGVAVDATGNIFVADSSNNRIRKITPTGQVSTLAGEGHPGFAEGASNVARFNGPTGVAVDSSGNVFVADAFNNRIRKIDGTGTVTTVAGNGMPGFSDGAALESAFFHPTGIALDTNGNLFVADQANNRIRRIDHQTGAVTTFAGTGTAGMGADSFDSPTGIAVDISGVIYVADTGNHRVQRIQNGVATTLAGTGVAGFADGTAGPGGTAQLRAPVAVAIDRAGIAYIADAIDHRIRLARL